MIHISAGFKNKQGTVIYKKFKVVKAKGLALWLLNKLSFVGWTSMWGVIYLHPNHMNNQRLIRHEQVHAIQIQRDGRLIQPIKYTYYLLKYGYKSNPYEIEARMGEDR